MSKKAKTKIKNKARPANIEKSRTPVDKNIFPWLLGVLTITGISFLPMLSNGFTNWDDQFYVLQNPLIKGPDWNAIFTQASASNYHPLTIASLAFNYAISGFNPFSYHLVNWLLHILNTALVFLFIYKLSGKRIYVAALSALIFGIHPMHVESVAWVSERKDVLYALFFLLALLQYCKFLETKKRLQLIFCFAFFILSLLSKPAAIILPIVLFLLDYWYNRSFNWKTIAEKIPFFILSLIFGYVTIEVQSADAIAGFDIYPLWTRFFFACYTVMIYAARFFIPYPLSAFHPYPSVDALSLGIWLSPLFIVALLIFLWLKRRDKLVVFCLLFFLVNLLLVMQVISIGLTIVSERYTYIPYIGLGFLISMWVEKYFQASSKLFVKVIPVVVMLIFGFISFQRTKVWKDGDTLWTNVIKHYPEAATPRSNHANYLKQLAGLPEYSSQKNELLQKALEECDVAIRLKPTHVKAYETRQNIYLLQNKDSLALADAEFLLKMQPQNSHGLYTKGVVYIRFKMFDSALALFNKSIDINPNSDPTLNFRGSLLFNNYQRYNDAVLDFTRAIAINPLGEYYFHRSLCYYKMGDVNKAKSDAIAALQKGYVLPGDYKTSLQIGQ